MSADEKRGRMPLAGEQSHLEEREWSEAAAPQAAAEVHHDALDGEYREDEVWRPAPPPKTHSFDSLEAKVAELQSAIDQSDWSRSAALGRSLSEELRLHREDPFLSSDALPEAAADGPFAALEKGLPDVPHFDEFGRCAAVERRYRPLMRFLAKRVFRIDVRGIERVPSEGRVILVANHGGILPYDALMLSQVMEEQHPGRRGARPLIEDMYYHAPFLGPWLYRMGCVRASRENARRLLEQDQAIAVFPEGYKGLHKPFAKRYQLQRFGRGGLIKLALRTQSPIVPVAIVGSEEANPLLGQLSRWTRPFGLPFFPVTPTFPLLGPLGLLPLPLPWVMHFGEPIALPGGAEESRDPLLVNRFVEEVRGQLQMMVNQILSQR